MMIRIARASGRSLPPEHHSVASDRGVSASKRSEGVRALPPARACRFSTALCISESKTSLETHKADCGLGCISSGSNFVMYLRVAHPDTRTVTEHDARMHQHNHARVEMERGARDLPLTCRR